MSRRLHPSPLREMRLDCGAFCISIDLERLWGVWDKVTFQDEQLCQAHEGSIVDRLLALFDRYEIPATWAVVGRLLDDNPGFDGLRGPRSGWYAPEAISAIQTASVDHEIGSHSYAHIYFGSSSADQVRADLEHATRTHSARDLPLRSFVFPRNDIGHLDELQRIGIRVFRSVDAGLLGWVSRHAARARPAVNLLEKAVPTPPPVVLPLIHEGDLVELPSSLLLIGRAGLRRVAHPMVLGLKLEQGLERAARERKLFHLWFHPSNFYFDAEAQFGILERGLARAARLRDAGKLELRTMGSFAQA